MTRREKRALAEADLKKRKFTARISYMKEIFFPWLAMAQKDYGYVVGDELPPNCPPLPEPPEVK